MEPKRPLNIWRNIEKTSVLRLDLVFEYSKIVGIHHSDFEDVVSDLDWLVAKLQGYRDEMAAFHGEPIKKFQSTHFTHVYLMYDKSTGHTKIGRSFKPQQREKTLISDKSSIELFFVSPHCESSIEKELHKIFKHKRVRGEWFDLNEEDHSVYQGF